MIYLHSSLFDFGFDQDGPTTMYEDSRAVIAMTDNSVNRKGSRHNDTRKHFIGELVQEKLIELAPCVADLMLADAPTKGLPTSAFMKHKVEMLGVGTKVYSECVSSFMIYSVTFTEFHNFI